MLVLTGREFRANQSKYFGAANKGEDVIVKSRSGNFRIVPVKADDIVISKVDLSERLYQSLKEVKEALQGKVKLKKWEDFLDEMED